MDVKRRKEQITRGYNIVADGWLGVCNPRFSVTHTHAHTHTHTVLASLANFRNSKAIQAIPKDGLRMHGNGDNGCTN